MATSSSRPPPRPHSRRTLSTARSSAPCHCCRGCRDLLAKCSRHPSGARRPFRRSPPSCAGDASRCCGSSRSRCATSSRILPSQNSPDTPENTQEVTYSYNYILSFGLTYNNTSILRYFFYIHTLYIYRFEKQ